VVVHHEGIRRWCGSQAPGSILFSNIFIIIALSSILLLVLLDIIVRRTKVGRAMRAVAYDKPTARLMGINVDGIFRSPRHRGGAGERAVCSMPLPSSIVF
jgi:branched-subunit amino acid ABC-type transport system permease component